MLLSRKFCRLSSNLFPPLWFYYNYFKSSSDYKKKQQSNKNCWAILYYIKKISHPMTEWDQIFYRILTKVASLSYERVHEIKYFIEVLLRFSGSNELLKASTMLWSPNKLNINDKNLNKLSRLFSKTPSKALH